MTHDKEPHISDDENRDPRAGAPGAHPVGTGLGVAGGAAAGAVAGAIAGPVGGAGGMVVGGIAGGLAGRAVAERLNPTVEDAYWRENFTAESYYVAGRSYKDYRPAYELGWSSRARRDGNFDTLESSLAELWNLQRGNSRLEWEQARPATRAAWDRAESVYFRTGDPDASVSMAEVLGNDGVVEVLNDLLETARDGEYGFQTCAVEVIEPNLQQLFYHRAEQCHQAADDLVQMIWRFGGTPGEGGTAGGALHRGWVHVKGAVGMNSDLSILAACERGEDMAVARYRKAVKQDLPAEVRKLVERQAHHALRNHNHIRDLRDKAREL